MLQYLSSVAIYRKLQYMINNNILVKSQLLRFKVIRALFKNMWASKKYRLIIILLYWFQNSIEDDCVPDYNTSCEKEENTIDDQSKPEKVNSTY